MDTEHEPNAMAQPGPGTATSGSDDAAGEGTLQTAKSAASDTASTAAEEAKKVASQVSGTARSVVEEAKGQVSGLAEQARADLRDQASQRAGQAASGMRTLSDQLQALADGRPQEAGPLSSYFDEARAKVATVASRLDEGGIDGLIDDVSAFARRRPALFLVAAGGAGFLAGRLLRSGAQAAKEADDSTEFASRPSYESTPDPGYELAPPTLGDAAGMLQP